LDKTCRELIDSLIATPVRHTLCLTIAEETFFADQVAAEHLRAKKKDVTVHEQPSSDELAEILGALEGKVAIVSFADLKKEGKSLDLLLEHVKKPSPGGKLIVVSRHWAEQ
jgi:hypothetical protein